MFKPVREAGQFKHVGVVQIGVKTSALIFTRCGARMRGCCKFVLGMEYNSRHD
jgi:hypothetical protein